MIRPAARALTIVEVVVSMAVVSSMLAASLYAAAASRATLLRWHDRAVATELADDLLGTVAAFPYSSPSGSILGIELDDVLGNKTTYDDVDDFDAWTESPPQDANGAPLAGFSGWSRSVRVRWVVATAPDTSSASESGVKEIVVIVKKGGVELARRTALRTNLPSTWN
jgi:hypothetical protein